MVISKESQLGLRFIYDIPTKVEALELMMSRIQEKKSVLDNEVDVLRKKQKEYEDVLQNGDEASQRDYVEKFKEFIISDIGEDLVANEAISSYSSIGDIFCYDDKTMRPKYDGKFFLIQNSVYKAAELIKIGDGFTGRVMKDIKHGSYMYLMGKHQMCRFDVVERGVKGIFYDDKDKCLFEWGIEMKTGKYFFTPGFQVQFSTIMQILTFIELGDIEVKVLKGLQNNGEKKDKKVYNATLNTVYVVDSSWNQLIIRTEGFAVRGHFKLQPCGPMQMDRKLIWINAYEKDGYIRKPKATILNK